MATNAQPLLTEKPKAKTSYYHKALYVLLSLVAVIGPIAFFTTKLVDTRSSLGAHVCDQASCPGTMVQMNDATLLQIILQKSTSHIRDTAKMANDVSRRINDPREQAALADCLELLDMAEGRVVDSVAALAHRTAGSHSDAHTWLSSVLTNHVTCLDGLSGLAGTIMESKLNDLISGARTSLALLVSLSPPFMKHDDHVLKPLHGNFPSWVTSKDRKLLQAMPNAINANVVVAKDGSGNYTTIKEAVDSAPDKGKSRYTIYVKAGTYKENIEIGKSKKNVMLTGDGMDKTIITGSLNVVDGSTTFNSATVAAVGDGFIAQDLWIQNTAGPEKHQAVALRVGADQSVINRCKLDAYQDTLYAHTLRQFYRDCNITGTVDFIFGNAGVVFQNCKLVARKPMSGQKNMITAQGRTDINQNTGTSIQNCDIIASSDLAPVIGSVKTFLGRPWKEFSRTVVMQSNIGDLIDPLGWAEWSGDFALKTLYYGEYLNRGAGAGTGGRVKWPGYHVITNATEASKFTVAQLIQGGVWLKSTGVAYTEGL